MGIGIALKSEVTCEDGVAQQNNFDKYLIPRMPDAPKVVRCIIDNPGDAMGGVGSLVCRRSPRLVQRDLHATGKRIRRLPVAEQLST